MSRLVALALALAAPAAGLAQAPGQSDAARIALIAKAKASVVDLLADPLASAGPTYRNVVLSEKACGHIPDSEWLGDRQCRVPVEESALGRNSDQGLGGSAIIVDADRGLVLTAYHILLPERSYRVTLADGRHVPLKYLGRDNASGLALGQIDATGLTALRLSTERPQAGQSVILIGRLLPLSTTLATGGMVAGSIAADDDRENLPVLADIWFLDNLLVGGGQGGGPVLDARGEVVGIATAIFGKATGYGQSAATLMVGVRDAAPIIAALAATGHVPRSVIGLSQNCEGEKCDVTAVDPDGAAAAAGVEVGDTLVAIDGRPILRWEILVQHVARQPVGTAVALDVRRNGEIMTLAVTTTDRSDSEPD